MFQVVESARLSEIDTDGNMTPDMVAGEIRLSDELMISESELAGLVTFTFNADTLRSTFTSETREPLERLVQWDAPDVHFGRITEV
jgi:hypothetical protein